jgi:acetyl-CoA carboxylase carboxyltransferase component
MADFLYMSDDAVFSYSPPMVAAAHTGASISADLTANSLKSKSELVSFTYSGVKELGDSLKKLLKLLSGSSLNTGDDPNRTDMKLNNHPCDVHTLLNSVTDKGSFLEVGKDFGKDAVCGLAAFGGTAVRIIATNAGENGGYISKNGLLKISKFIRSSHALHSLPLITFIDSNGISPSEDVSLLSYVTEVPFSMPQIYSAKMAVITGKAIGYAYSAFASKEAGYNYVYATVNAMISPIGAEAAVNVLYADEIAASPDPVLAREQLVKRYTEDVSNPYVAAKDGYIDNIIEPATIRPYIISTLNSQGGRYA